MLDALEELSDATDANIARARQIKRRITALRRQVAGETPLADIVRNEARPLIVELITENILTLQSVGAGLRWSEANALKQEGLSVADIARLFGVSRQRISALLIEPPVAVERSQG